MSVSNISSGYLGSIESLKGRNDPEAVKAVAKEMEALFAYELIKAMRKTTGQSSKGGLGGEIYTSMFDMELAKLCAEKGLGIKEMLIKNLEKQKYLQQYKEQIGKVTEEPSTQPVSIPVVKQGQAAVKDAKDAKKSLLPVDGKVTSKFGFRRHPIHGDIRFHYGTDIAASYGKEINPVRDGKVIFSGHKSGYGNIVEIDHGDGILSRYAHNQANLVKKGDYVSTDTVIAKVGSTGKTTGPHLHFEVEYKGRRIDPLKFIDLA